MGRAKYMGQQYIVDVVDLEPSSKLRNVSPIRTMDSSATVNKEIEDGDAQALVIASSLEEAPEAFRSSPPLHEEEDNCVTVAQLPPPSLHTPPNPIPIPKPYLDPSSSSSTVPDYRRMSLSYVQNSGLCYALSLSGEARSNALFRAEELKSNLGHVFPSFVKPLVRSHVASCFWMGLPAQFCKAHLPEKDTNVILEDECEELFEIKYIAYRTGLSAGWREFSARHKLLEGDVLVFQLVEPTKFKVYIIRANNCTEVDGDSGLLKLDSKTKQFNAEINESAFNNSRRKRPKSLPSAVVQKKNKHIVLPISMADPDSNCDSEEVGSEVLEELELFAPSVQFKDVKNFQDFKIVVDGMIFDAELSEHIRYKYYKLCCSQNAFLHEKLISGINYKLVCGSISETVNIADAIRASKFTTPREEFISWDKTLTAFEILGMNVGFLRTRLHHLVSLVLESEGSKDMKRYVEAKTERALVHNEIRNIEARLEALKEVSRRSSLEIQGLKWRAEKYELNFEELVSAPW